MNMLAAWSHMPGFLVIDRLSGREAHVPIFQVARNPLKLGMPTLSVLKMSAFFKQAENGNKIDTERLPSTEPFNFRSPMMHHPYD